MGAMFKLATTTYLILMGLGINASHISYGKPYHQYNASGASGQKSLVDESPLVPFVIAGSVDPEKPPGESGGPSGGGAAGGRCVPESNNVEV